MMLKGASIRILVGVEESLVDSIEHFKEKLGYAHELRATKATGRNEQSSRSHCICRLRVLHTGGVLTWVDLAGSERNQDTLHYSAADHMESADINKALNSLKDCFRALTVEV